MLAFIAGLIGSLCIVLPFAFMRSDPKTDSKVTTPEIPMPDQAIVLRALMTGYVGVGGAINGVVNPSLSLMKGSKVTIQMINGEDMPHDIVIDTPNGNKVASIKLYKVNETTSFVFSPLSNGIFNYYCSLPGHRSAGMEGVVFVGDTTSTIPIAQPVTKSRIALNPTNIPPPINRNTPQNVDIYLSPEEHIAEIKAGSTYNYYTYNGTVPGPLFRVVEGDYVTVHFYNNASNTMIHSVDFHAVTGPGGGAVATQTKPGDTTVFSFKALRAGIYVYHCASPHVPTHISLGMYGLILVEPLGGLPPVDKEFYLMQGEMYTNYPYNVKTHFEQDDKKLHDENPEFVVFNGMYKGLTGLNALRANQFDKIRIYFGVGGPNLIASFHVIGEIFDTVYSEGSIVSPPKKNVQTTLVAPGGATVVEMELEVPGAFTIVDHALGRTMDKGCAGVLLVTGVQNYTIFDWTGIRQ